MPEKPKTYFQSEVERLYEVSTLTPEKYEQVRQSKIYMQQHFSQNIELSHLATAAHMSRFHYVRVFQQIYGLTPRVYLRDLRIAKAKELIKQGVAITQVCFDVGYQSLPTFSSIFKKRTGHSAKNYQLMHKRNLE